MLYGSHGSKGRPWWGTIVIGGGQAAGLREHAATGVKGMPSKADKVDVTAAWAGWLKVERASVPGFGLGLSVEEAMRDCARRHEAFEAAGWVARSVWGELRLPT
jgi:hypothetical protein